MFHTVKIAGLFFNKSGTIKSGKSSRYRYIELWKAFLIHDILMFQWCVVLSLIVVYTIVRHTICQLLGLKEKEGIITYCTLNVHVLKFMEPL